MFFEQEIEQLFTGIYVKTLGHSNNILEECLSIEKARVAALEAASRSLRRLLCFFFVSLAVIRARMMPGISEVMRDTSCELVVSMEVFLVSVYPLPTVLHHITSVFCE